MVFWGFTDINFIILWFLFVNKKTPREAYQGVFRTPTSFLPFTIIVK